MICPLCEEDVWCLNCCAPKENLFNQPTEACYNCRHKYDLQIIDYPKGFLEKKFRVKDPVKYKKYLKDYKKASEKNKKLDDF